MLVPNGHVSRTTFEISTTDPVPSQPDRSDECHALLEPWADDQLERTRVAEQSIPLLTNLKAFYGGIVLQVNRNKRS